MRPQHTTLAPALFAAALALSTGCAGDLDDELGTEVVPAQTGSVGPHARTEDREGDVQATTIDATDEELWVYFDLETGREVSPADPSTDLEWDLAFQRFHIASNGGISGSAGVEVAVIDTGFEAVTAAPEDGFDVDAADGPDDNEDPEYVLSDWYDYNPMTHVLTPKPRTYVVRTGAGHDFKVALEAYYDDAGTSAIPTFLWRAL